MPMAETWAGPRVAEELTERRSTFPTSSAPTSAPVGLPTLFGADAFGREREQRARVSLRWAAVVATTCALLLQLVQHKTTVHWVVTGAVLTMAVASTVVLYLVRGERPVGERRMMVMATLGVSCVLTGVAYVGVLSPTVVILCVAIYFWGTGDLPYATRFVYGLSALGYAAIAALSYVEVLPLTHSVLPLASENKRALVGFTVLLEVVFAYTLWLAQQGRKATVRAVAALEQERRQVQQREALLNEARADLERAREAGRLGRFTGRRIGSFLAGDVIGRGATGEVYEARDAEQGTPAAIKVLHPYLFSAGIELERFLREADVASRIESPHVVRVLESGRAEDGSPYFAMELLTGSDLAALLRERRRLGLREILTLAAHVGDALAIAQEVGVVHRDIKPQNLFLSEDPHGKTWKVLDFGVSKIGEEAATLTRGAAVGTPGYMAPEQARGHAVDHRADVFSLGAVVYRALTGRPAFTAQNSVATLYQVAYVQPAQPSDLVQVDPDVNLVLALALAKDPAQRFRSAATFAAALRDATRGELDDPFRAAAKALLARHAWGSDASARA